MPRRCEEESDTIHLWLASPGSNGRLNGKRQQGRLLEGMCTRPVRVRSRAVRAATGPRPHSLPGSAASSF